MNKGNPASYALQRQMVAVERAICASTPEEALKAARWAQAWQRLVQIKLDQMRMMSQRVLH